MSSGNDTIRTRVAGHMKILVAASICVAALPEMAIAYSYRGPMSVTSCSHKDDGNFTVIQGTMSMTSTTAPKAIAWAKVDLPSGTLNHPRVESEYIYFRPRPTNVDVVIERTIRSSSGDGTHTISYTDPTSKILTYSKYYPTVIYYRAFLSTSQAWIELSGLRSPFSRSITIPILYGYGANENIEFGGGEGSACHSVKRADLINDINDKYASQPRTMPFLFARDRGAATASFEASLFPLFN